MSPGNPFNFNVTVSPGSFQLSIHQDFTTEIIPQFILPIVPNVVGFCQSGYVLLNLKGKQIPITLTKTFNKKVYSLVHFRVCILSNTFSLEHNSQFDNCIGEYTVLQKRTYHSRYGTMGMFLLQS